jgi:hypothetical protein
MFTEQLNNLLNILKRRSIVSNTSYRTLNIRSKYKCLHVISPERNKAILTWIIQNIVDLWKSNIYHASAIQNKFWPPPSFKKTSWSLNYFPGITTSLQTDRHKFSNRNLYRLYITRPKRLDTSKRRHAILHVKNSVLPSAAIKKNRKKISSWWECNIRIIIIIRVSETVQ